MILYYTPKSHFARKVRLLLDLLEIPCELKDVGNVAGHEKHQFGGNPLMKVPVLVDGKDWIIDSDHIALYLTKKFSAHDPFDVGTQSLFDLNARAIMNGIMLEEVKLILAQRTGVPTQDYAFFHKATETIEQGLGWIQANISNFDNKDFKYRDLHLLCLWEHLQSYQMVPGQIPISSATPAD